MAKAANPAADRLIGNRDAALSQEILDVAQAQGDTVIRPNGIADDASREAEPLIRDKSSTFSMDQATAIWSARRLDSALSSADLEGKEHRNC